MHIRLLAVTALTAVLAVGCTAQQTKTSVITPQFTPSPASMLANTCSGCHGTFGDSMGPATPTIAGMEADYIVEVMEDYKSGERHNTIMTRIAKGYTDKEIELMAGFFSQQTYNGFAQVSADSKSAMGKKLHDNYCEKCHEDGGTSIEDTPLTGQWMPYMSNTITDYLNGHNNPEKKMKKAVDKMIADHPNMSKAQLAEDLARYYASRK